MSDSPTSSGVSRSENIANVPRRFLTSSKNSRGALPKYGVASKSPSALSDSHGSQLSTRSWRPQLGDYYPELMGSDPYWPHFDAATSSSIGSDADAKYDVAPRIPSIIFDANSEHFAAPTISSIGSDACPKYSDNSTLLSLPHGSKPSPLSAIHRILDSTLPGNQNHIESQFDTTGQIEPPGSKPHVTATIWEAEETFCLLVERNGVCVARREDNRMINGTWLLSAAGVRRDRIENLRREKVYHCIRFGPRYLRGHW
jgi:hypothetical protein